MKTFSLTENEMIMMIAAMAGITVEMKVESIFDRLERVGKILKEYGLDSPNSAITDFMNNYFLPFGEPTPKLQKKVQNLAKLQAETFEFLEPEPATQNTEDNDSINSPSHYTWLKEKIGIEPLDICEHFNYNVGSALKYLMRAGRKRENNSLTLSQNAYIDLMKAATFCKREAKNRLVEIAVTPSIIK